MDVWPVCCGGSNHIQVRKVGQFEEVERYTRGSSARDVVSSVLNRHAYIVASMDDEDAAAGRIPIEG